MRELGPQELTAALEAFYGREGLGPAAAISAEKLQTLADFWPLCGFIYDGPADDPAARERWLGEDGAPCSREVRDALAAATPFEERADRDRARRRWSSGEARSRRMSTSRFASRWRAARCRPGSSKPSPCLGARRRSPALIERSIPDGRIGR